MKYFAIIIILIFCSSSFSAGFLKQNTVAEIAVGPLVDCVDGKTLVETLDINDVNAAMYKNSIRTELTVSAENMSHIADGCWKLALTVEDVNTIGNLKITLRDDDVFLFVSEDFLILPSDVYGSVFSTNGFQLAGNTITAATFDSETRDLINQIDRRNSSVIETLMQSCVVRYKMDDNADSIVVLDSSGNNHHGISVRNTNLMHTTGKVGGALEFNGTSDYIDTGDNFESVFQDSFSISLWFKPAYQGHRQLLGAYDLSGNRISLDYSGSEDDEEIVLNYLANGHPETEATISCHAPNTAEANEWTFVAITADSTTRTFMIYVNGVSVNEYSYLVDDPEFNFYDFVCSYNLFLGSRNVADTPQSYWNGSLDDITIFNKALSAEEIQLFYNLGQDYALESNATANKDAILQAITDKPVTPAVDISGLATAADMAEIEELIESLNDLSVDDIREIITVGRPAFK